MARRLLIVLAIFALLVGGWSGWRAFRDARVARRAVELGKVLEEEIREWEARDRARPPLFEPVVPGAAWEHYREAWRLREELDETSPEVADWDGEGLPAPLPPEVARWVKHYEPALLAVRRGTCTSRIGVADDLRVGNLTFDEEEDAPPSHANAIASGLSDLLEVRAAVDLDAGDVEAAVTWLLVSSRLGADLASSGTSVHAFAGRTLAGNVRADLARLIGGGRIPAEEVERAAGLSPLTKPGWAAMEALWLGDQVDLMRTAQGEWAWLEELNSIDNWFERTAFSFVRPDPQDALDTWVDLRARFPEWRKAWPGSDDDSLARAARGIGGTQGGSPVLWQLFAGSLQTNLELTLSHRSGPDEQHEMLQFNIALFRYRQREGKDPETIEEIRPEGVRETTSLGAWDWGESEHLPLRWIKRGTPADEAERERETEDLVRELSEGD